MRYVLCKRDVGENFPLPHNPCDIQRENEWMNLQLQTAEWEQIKADPRFHRIPSLARSAKNLPQKVKDYLAGRGIDYDPHESVADILVKLTGNEDFARD